MKLPKFLIPAIVLIGVIMFQSAFIVKEIDQAIVLQFGNPKKIITEAGLKFKLPFIQNVVYIDRRILKDLQFEILQTHQLLIFFDLQQ